MNLQHPEDLAPCLHGHENGRSGDVLLAAGRRSFDHFSLIVDRVLLVALLARRAIVRKVERLAGEDDLALRPSPSRSKRNRRQLRHIGPLTVKHRKPGLNQFLLVIVERDDQALRVHHGDDVTEHGFVDLGQTPSRAEGEAVVSWLNS